MQEPNPFTFQSDVYAYGVVLFELGAGQLPYSHISNRDMILFNVGRGYIRPDFKQMRNDCPKNFIKLTKDTTSIKRDERPLFKEVGWSLSCVELLDRSFENNSNINSLFSPKIGNVSYE